MSATQNVRQLQQSLNSVPSHGVLTVYGYGIKVFVERGHLSVEYGIGEERCRYQLPRVGHRLSRLVIIGSDGFVTLAALRWLVDQDASFVMLERDGSVLATASPTGSSDPRLRRAQAMSHDSGVSIKIARELIHQKLEGQEGVVRHKLKNCQTAESIAQTRLQLAEAETISQIRLIESRAGAAYWSAWHSLPINFPKNDLPRVPEHWRVFGTRKSPLSGSPRYAANPANACLNFLYGILTSEARLAMAAMGLDPGLGMLHVDAPHRDSLACDVLEPVRPKIDAYVLDRIQQQVFNRNWFFEQRDGNCRLMTSFAVRLSETAPLWRRAVAPLAEWVAQTLWSALKRPAYERVPTTRLTRDNKRRTGSTASRPFSATRYTEYLCATCGVQIRKGSKYCLLCGVEASREQLRRDAKQGRIAAQSDAAQARRKATKLRQDAERKGWLPSSLPAWLTTKVFTERVQPRLVDVSNSILASTIGVSLPYAADIRMCRRQPHPRHWQVLAKLVGIFA